MPRRPVRDMAEPGRHGIGIADNLGDNTTAEQNFETLHDHHKRECDYHRGKCDVMLAGHAALRPTSRSSGAVMQYPPAVDLSPTHGIRLPRRRNKQQQGLPP